MSSRDHADLETEHQTEAHRFVLRSGGDEVGWLLYRHLDDGVVDVRSTRVDDAHRGQGLAAVLVRDALDSFTEDGLQVVPSCWYVAEYLDRHPELEHLRHRRGERRAPSRSAPGPGATPVDHDRPGDAGSGAPTTPDASTRRADADVARRAAREGMSSTDPDRWTEGSPR